MHTLRICIAISVLLQFPLSSWPAETAVPSKGEAGRYQFLKKHDPDGSGKFYLGREIALVMGDIGAPWLERSSREAEEHSDRLAGLLKIQPGDVIADIGAGTGYHSRRLAGRTGPTGRILAVDIQPEMLDLLTNKMAEAGVTNVVPILGTITDPQLPPSSVDLAVLVDVYHEFSHPYEMMEALCRALKPRGRVAFVEFRAEDPEVPIKTVHKMSEAQVKKEMVPLPLEWVETIETLPWQHVVVFRKRN